MKNTFYRCLTCGKLLGEKMVREGTCAGHRMRIASQGSLWEWIKTRVGAIR